MKNHKWEKVNQRSLSNLHVLTVNNVIMGFIHKPRDSKTDKNMWRLYRGYGEKGEFLTHVWTKTDAIALMNKIFGAI